MGTVASGDKDHGWTKDTIDFSKPYDTYTAYGIKTTLGKNKKGIFIIKQGDATRKIVRY